jgi:hypothetical protein
MNDANQKPYVAVFALDLGGGVTVERYRASRGGLHKMRLVHHDSRTAVEREYDDNEAVLSVREDLIVKLQARLSEIGLSWGPTHD